MAGCKNDSSRKYGFIKKYLKLFCDVSRYIIFTAIYYAAGGENDFGQPYVYNVLDWREPGYAIGIAFATGAIVFVIQLLIYAVHIMR